MKFKKEDESKRIERINDNISIYIKKKENNDRCSFYLINNNGDLLTPALSSIKYDVNNNLFFVSDKLNIDENYTCGIHYYLDEFGIPCSMAFSDIDDYFFDMPFKTSEEFIEKYFSYKCDVINHFRKRQLDKFMFKKENAKKLALVKK